MGLALGVTYEKNQEAINAATQRLFDYTHQIIEERRKTPSADFISHLIEANTDKSQLSDQELYDMVVLAVFGGIDTTRNQIGLGMSVFIDNPDQWKLLGEHPEYARGAVEEVMRTRPTTTWVTREALEDIEFKDVSSRRGRRCTCSPSPQEPTRKSTRPASTSPRSARRTTASAPGRITVSATSSPAPT